MRKKILGFVFATALLVGTVTPALAAGAPPTPAATVTVPSADPTSGGTVVPDDIVTVDVESDHAGNAEDVADVMVP